MILSGRELKAVAVGDGVGHIDGDDAVKVE